MSTILKFYVLFIGVGLLAFCIRGVSPTPAVCGWFGFSLVCFVGSLFFHERDREEDNPIKGNCPMCEGRGHIRLHRGGTERCPKCRGTRIV